MKLRCGGVLLPGTSDWHGSGLIVMTQSGETPCANQVRGDGEATHAMLPWVRTSAHRELELIPEWAPERLLRVLALVIVHDDKRRHRH